MARNEVLPETIQFGKYQLLERIANGRMGEVFKAKRGGVEGFEKVLVVKRLFPHLSGSEVFVNAFVDEAKLTVSLSHANIVQVMDLGQNDSCYFMAMEHVAGLDLGTVRRILGTAGRPFPLDIAVFTVSEVAKGLDYAHRRKDYNFESLNIVHRDLSPHNVLISYEGEIKIIDFGISRALEVFGTAHENLRRQFLYTSPEQARGEAVTHRSDIFSLGLILYELVTGVHPYDDPDPRVVQRRAREGVVRPVRQVAELPRALEQIINSSLIADPAQRVDSAGTLYEELISYLFASGHKADNRSLSQFMDQVKELEDQFFQNRSASQGLMQAIASEEIEEIDFDDLVVLDDDDAVPDIWELGDAAGEAGSGLIGGSGLIRPEGVMTATSAEIPSARLMPRRDVDRSRFDPVPQPDAMPRRLSELADGLRAGHGGAVVLTGTLGSGVEYLPDRLPARLKSRGLFQVLELKVTTDDHSVAYRLAAEVVRYAGSLQSQGVLERGREMGPESRAEELAALTRLSGCGLTGDEYQMALQLAGAVNHLRRGFHAKRDLTLSLVGKIVRALTMTNPFVVVIDGVDRLDPLSRDLLAQMAGYSVQFPLLLIVSSNTEHELGSVMALGDDARHFETVDAGGRGAAAASEESMWSGAGAVAKDVLGVLALADQPMPLSTVEWLLKVPTAQLDQAVQQLKDAGALRTIAPEHLSPATDHLQSLVCAELAAGTVRRAGEFAVRMLELSRSEDGHWATPAVPLRIRLLGWLRRPDDAVALALEYGRYLCREGWREIALESFRAVEAFLSRVGALRPQGRIDLRCASARLCIELMQARRAQSLLTDVRSLAMSVGDDRRGAEVALLLANIAFLDGHVAAAWSALTAAADTAAVLRDTRLVLATAVLRARWMARHGDFSSAQSELGRWFAAADGWAVDPVDHGAALALQIEILTGLGLGSAAAQVLEMLQALAHTQTCAELDCLTVASSAHLHMAGGKPEIAASEAETAYHLAREHNLVEAGLGLALFVAEAALDAGQSDKVLDYGTHLTELGTGYGYPYIARRGRDLASLGAVLTSTGDRALDALQSLHRVLREAQESAVAREQLHAHILLFRALSHLGSGRDAEHHRREAVVYARQCHADGIRRRLEHD
jgi:prepilin-type processing-associated H-X9-DG protein